MSEREMSLDEYQQEALRTATVDEMDPCAEVGLACDALGLVGEAGEAADHVKKFLGHGHPLDTNRLTKELEDGEVPQYVLAHRIGVPLSEVAAVNVATLRARYPDGFSSNRSINRAEEP